MDDRYEKVKKKTLAFFKSVSFSDGKVDDLQIVAKDIERRGLLVANIYAEYKAFLDIVFWHNEDEGYKKQVDKYKRTERIEVGILPRPSEEEKKSLQHGNFSPGLKGLFRNPVLWSYYKSHFDHLSEYTHDEIHLNNLRFFFSPELNNPLEKNLDVEDLLSLLSQLETLMLYYAYLVYEAPLVPFVFFKMDHASFVVATRALMARKDCEPEIQGIIRHRRSITGKEEKRSPRVSKTKEAYDKLQEFQKKRGPYSVGGQIKRNNTDADGHRIDKDIPKAVVTIINLLEEAGVDLEKSKT